MAVYTEAPVNKEKHGDSDTPITARELYDDLHLTTWQKSVLWG